MLKDILLVRYKQFILGLLCFFSSIFLSSFINESYIYYVNIILLSLILFYIVLYNIFKFIKYFNKFTYLLDYILSISSGLLYFFIYYFLSYNALGNYFLICMIPVILYLENYIFLLFNKLNKLSFKYKYIISTIISLLIFSILLLILNINFIKTHYIVYLISNFLLISTNLFYVFKLNYNFEKGSYNVLQFINIYENKNLFKKENYKCENNIKFDKFIKLTHVIFMFSFLYLFLVYYISHNIFLKKYLIYNLLDNYFVTFLQNMHLLVMLYIVYFYLFECKINKILNIILTFIILTLIGITIGYYLAKFSGFQKLYEILKIDYLIIFITLLFYYISLSFNKIIHNIFTKYKNKIDILLIILYIVYFLLLYFFKKETKGLERPVDNIPFTYFFSSMFVLLSITFLVSLFYFSNMLSKKQYHFVYLSITVISTIMLISVLIYFSYYFMRV